MGVGVLLSKKEYISWEASNIESELRPGAGMSTRVHVKIDRNGDLTLREVLKKIQEIQAENPDLDVFFDGDSYSICSRPKKQADKQ